MSKMDRNKGLLRRRSRRVREQIIPKIESSFPTVDYHDPETGVKEVGRVSNGWCCPVRPAPVNGATSWTPEADLIAVGNSNLMMCDNLQRFTA
jgi:hypothetical protein